MAAVRGRSCRGGCCSNRTSPFEPQTPGRKTTFLQFFSQYPPIHMVNRPCVAGAVQPQRICFNEYHKLLLPLMNRGWDYWITRIVHINSLNVVIQIFHFLWNIQWNLHPSTKLVKFCAFICFKLFKNSDWKVIYQRGMNKLKLIPTNILCQTSVCKSSALMAHIKEV